jgi:hypothetical protein
MIERVMQNSHHGNHQPAFAASVWRVHVGGVKTRHFFIDLTQRPPRSFRVRLGNYVILARMLDKGRATLENKKGENI